MVSKEERLLELFLNEPSKHWHFTEIVKTSKVSEPVAGKWLKKMQKDKLIERIKPVSRMPYFIGRYKDESYRNRKRLYAMQKLYETGVVDKLQKLKAKAVVIFGSFSRSDWNTQSDVDIFVLGDSGDLKYGHLWHGLGFQGRARELQVHGFKSILEVRKIRSGLMKNVVKGYFVKGSIHDIAKVEI